MTIHLDEQQIEAVLQGILIPPQPQIMVDLQMEQFQPTPDLARIAELIARDVGLAGTVLKIVNSAAFGIANEIGSIRQAVLLLGVTSVVNIVNGISIRGELSDGDIIKLNSFWDTSNDIAVVAQLVARQLGMSTTDDAYSLGLFHNAGIVLMSQRFANYMEVLEDAYGGGYERLIDAENQIFKTNHAVIGYYVARSWKLPPAICDVIAEHHSAKRFLSRDSATQAPQKQLLAVLKIAEHICGNSRTLGAAADDHEWTQIATSVYEFTGLGDYDLQALIEDCKEMGIESVISNH